VVAVLGACLWGVMAECCFRVWWLELPAGVWLALALRHRACRVVLLLSILAAALAGHASMHCQLYIACGITTAEGPAAPHRRCTCRRPATTQCRRR
jgi:hypothetical protein